MFRYLAVAGGLAMLLLWAGPWITKASKRVMKKQDELYDSLDEDDKEDDDLPIG